MSRGCVKTQIGNDFRGPLTLTQGHTKQLSVSWQTFFSPGIFDLRFHTHSQSLIDIVKFGWCTTLVTQDLEEKIDCLVNNNV